MDLRYLHETKFVPEQSSKSDTDLPVPASLVYPGWVDADSYEWAKGLKPPGYCPDIFCPCQSFIADLF